MVVYTRDRIESLRAFVDARVRRDGCDHTHRFSREWATREAVGWDDLLDLLERHGGHCDCEVVMNVPEDTDLASEPRATPVRDADRWKLPPTFAASPEDRFEKMIVCDAGIGRNTHARAGEVLVPAPKGAKARKRVRQSIHFFVGVASGLPAEVGVVSPCEAVSAEAFARRVAESGLAEFAGFTYREAAFVLSRVATLAPGTTVGTHFMDVTGVAAKHEELRVIKVIVRR